MRATTIDNEFGPVDHEWSDASRNVANLSGWVDIINNRRVAGWVWNKGSPSARLDIVVRLGGAFLSKAKASTFRADLQRAGIGDGCYSFDVRLNRVISDDELSSVSVEVLETGYFVPIAQNAIRPDLKDCQINVYNFDKLRAQPPSKFGVIRFDPNNDCNLRCVYCHNHRSKDVIDAGAFRTFLHQNVIGTLDFQVGCIMEPTLDSRLADFMLMVAASPAKPSGSFVLQTNGILLHRHDYGKMAEAGLNQLQVSLDTADPGTQRSLRSGMSLQKVVRNVAGFREAQPDIDVSFIATVTSENVEKTDNLVSLGLDIGVRKFVFREVFYHPENDVVDHERMPELLLQPGAFAAMKQRLIQMFGAKASLTFADEEFLEISTEKMLLDSARL